MSGGLFSRIKTWALKEQLLSPDLNSEFDNIISHFMPVYMDCYSHNVPEMQVQTDPGGLGSENLATALSGELERLRFALNRAIGSTYWYQAPAISLSAANAALSASGQVPQNRVVTGRTSANSIQPMFLTPNGAAATVTLKSTTTPIQVYIAGTFYSFNADVSKTGLNTAPASNNTATVNDATLAGGAATKVQGENSAYGPWNGTKITVSSMGTNITALVGKLAAFKKTGTEYFIGYVESTTLISKCYRGFFFDSSDTPIPRAVINNGDTLTLMKLTWVYLKIDGTLLVSYTNPTFSLVQPSSPASGDYWFDQSAQIWKSYNGAAWVSATATLVGICIQDTTNCVAARSIDTYQAFSAINGFNIEVQSNTQVRASALSPHISAYGQLKVFDDNLPVWDTATALETGTTIGASATYYLYITNLGDVKISQHSPHVRLADLYGLYHPYESWRCVGSVTTDGSSHFISVVDANRLDGSQLNANSILPGALTPLSVAPSNLQAVNVVESASCGVFNSLSADNTYALITGLTSPAIILGGVRPVRIELIPDGNTTNAAVIGTTPAKPMNIRLKRGSTVIAVFATPEITTGSQSSQGYSHMAYEELPAAGTYVYTAEAQVSDHTSTYFIQYYKLRVREV